MPQRQSLNEDRERNAGLNFCLSTKLIILRNWTGLRISMNDNDFNADTEKLMRLCTRMRT